ncbi:MAG: cysteine desulfurase [Deltaproteobacteria bacterium]|nr:cysteine desulfurase [Deltaproteobacteria bacterium]
MLGTTRIIQSSDKPDLFSFKNIRLDFPILEEKVHGKQLVYLDSAATTQKPRVVIDTLRDYYEKCNSNVHRAVHYLGEKATRGYESSRKSIAQFINAEDVREIVFTRGTTESVNLVASSYGRTFLKPGDEVLISYLEHHSNIVPWQIVCNQTGAQLKVAPINDQGEIILEEFKKLLSPKTKIVSIAQVSNALGTINPLEKMIPMAHDVGAVVLVDGAQAASHMSVDVQKLGCDFYAFSGHKIYGPTGIGVLYGKAHLLEKMPPYHGGGEMILSVTFEKTTYNEIPYKFEAGTPNIAGAFGMQAALKYVSGIGLDNIAAYESGLLQYATLKLSRIPGLKLIGTAKNKACVLSFTLEGIHPHDIGTILDREGVAIRTGHHCAMPVMQRFGVPATARVSLGIYNNREDIDIFVEALLKVGEIFR